MLNTVYGPDRFGLSFELFPPKTEAGEQALFRHVEQLMQFQPSYVTCTYGAGGSTRAKTLDVVSGVKDQFQVPVASHLTCVGATQEDLKRLGLDNPAETVSLAKKAAEKGGKLTMDDMMKIHGT